MLKTLRMLFGSTKPETLEKKDAPEDLQTTFRDADDDLEIPLLTDVVLLPENEPPGAGEHPGGRTTADDKAEALETIIQDTLKEFIPLIAETVAKRLTDYQRQTGSNPGDRPFTATDPADAFQENPDRSASG